jgi:AAA+ superfamily predicted ATPase
MAPDSVLMAATNHAELWDKAVWRRFQTTIEVGNPSNAIKQQILKVQIGDFPCEFISDNKQLSQLATLLEQSSPADMHTTINKAQAK